MSINRFDVDKKWDYENGFYLTSHTTRIAKLLAHYELYKSIIDLPGHIIECGVFKGSSLIRFCTYRELLESPWSRKIIAFDAFGKFPSQECSYDQEFVENFEISAGYGISSKELSDCFTYKGFDNYELIQGDIEKTVPEYILNHPELKLCLLHIDVDVYQPTHTILKYLFDKVVKGGIVVFDDFGTTIGETKAIDEFFKEKNSTINKLPLSHIPSYMRV